MERRGGETYLDPQSGGQKDIVAHMPGDADVAIGDTVEIGFSVAQSHLFGPDGQSIR